MEQVEIVRGAPRFALDQIRRVVSSACERVCAERALLFGSYARGSADRLSDVDLILVCDTELPFLERFRLFVDVLDALPGADLLVYTPQEFETARGAPGVVERACREAITLYERASP